MLHLVRFATMRHELVKKEKKRNQKKAGKTELRGETRAKAGGAGVGVRARPASSSKCCLCEFSVWELAEAHREARGTFLRAWILTVKV